MEAQPLLSIENLKTYFYVRDRVAKAVNDVSLAIQPGETLGLVGESGCGKTTVGKGILQLIRPTGGSVRFEDSELTTLKGERLRRRRSDFQFIFQDPYASLDPRMTVAASVTEPLLGQNSHSKQARRSLAAELLAAYKKEGVA